MDGCRTDKLKLLKRCWTPTVTATWEILVLSQVFKSSDEIDIQTVDSARVLPKREDIDASNAENSDPLTTSMIEPESGE
jgi:hypothetical protein